MFSIQRKVSTYTQVYYFSLKFFKYKIEHRRYLCVIAWYYRRNIHFNKSVVNYKTVFYFRMKMCERMYDRDYNFVCSKCTNSDFVNLQREKIFYVGFDNSSLYIHICVPTPFFQEVGRKWAKNFNETKIVEAINFFRNVNNFLFAVIINYIYDGM